jgi:hypothetical protein
MIVMYISLFLRLLPFYTYTKRVPQNGQTLNLTESPLKFNLRQKLELTPNLEGSSLDDCKAPS